MQFLAKFFAWYSLRTEDKELISKYLSISGKLFNTLIIDNDIDSFRDARSVFRLTKSLFEIKRIKIIQKTKDTFAKIVNTLSRLFYFVFWFFDNIYIMIKLLNSQSPNKREFYRILSRRFQLIGQFLYLIYCIKTLRRTYTDESDLKVAALNKMTVK